MSGQCPVCTAAQAESLACHACTTRLERALGDVRSLVTELDTAKSKQARIGNPSGGGGLARERNPISWGAVEAADTLGNVLTTWAREVATNGALMADGQPAAVQAARALYTFMDLVRRHPAVAELVDEITDAVEQARRAVDRPADRMYLGQCATVFPDEDGQDVECYAELWGKPDASEIACRVCLHVHPVRERREWLVAKAGEMVVTAKQASLYLSDVGRLDVSESSIRNWVGRGKILLRPGYSTQRTFELGALMDYIGRTQAHAATASVADVPMAV